VAGDTDLLERGEEEEEEEEEEKEKEEINRRHAGRTHIHLLEERGGAAWQLYGRAAHHASCIMDAIYARYISTNSDVG